MRPHCFKNSRNAVKSGWWWWQNHTLCSLTDFPLHIRSSPIAASIHTLQSPIYTSFSPVVFLPLRGQLMAVPLMYMFSPTWESQNVRTHCQKCNLMTCKDPGHLSSQTEFLRDTGTAIQTLQNRYEWDPYSLRPHMHCFCFALLSASQWPLPSSKFSQWRRLLAHSWPVTWRVVQPRPSLTSCAVQ